MYRNCNVSNIETNLNNVTKLMNKSIFQFSPTSIISNNSYFLRFPTNSSIQKKKIARRKVQYKTNQRGMRAF